MISKLSFVKIILNTNHSPYLAISVILIKCYYGVCSNPFNMYKIVYFTS